MCVPLLTFCQKACVGRDERALHVAFSPPPWATTAPPLGSTTAGSRSAGTAAGESQRRALVPNRSTGAQALQLTLSVMFPETSLKVSVSVETHW